ncbi:restriction endonuclease subunit S [Hafnia paralvei]|uniref:Restriction endonuclease subunit S n=1 Tax=Hafnia paralvei TaxID=546367 RepID=A0A4V2J873_9GAMM|nr:restriction endonuclease subunit S [Hafnia paralvei]TBM31477.1 restriction endonuclease subunit S [Hafnia paralvei]
MAKYKAYPEYKDSGVEWWGEVPITWSIFKLKFGLSEPLVYGANEAALDDNPNNPRYIRITDMNPDGTLRRDTFKSLPKMIAEPYMLIDGDILLARSGATVGKSFYYRSIFGASCFAGYLIRARFNREKIIPRLAYWFCQSSIYWQYISGSQIQATIQNVSAEKYSDLYLSAPLEYAEQVRVVNFLDHETAKIDNLIEKQQQLIELLKEKRQAVISHAVTKGLNPDVPMKDSGVEWLGEVPEHWLCTKIKYIALLTPKKSSVTFKNNDECTFIPMEKLKRNSLVTDESKLIRDVISGYTYFEDDDLLLAKVTPCFENKNIAVARGLVNRIGFGSTEIYVLRPTEKIRVNYLLYRLQEDNFIRAATGAMTGAGGLKRVPSDFLLNYPIAIPPKPEMDAIVDYLNEQEVHYDLMEKNATQAVQLLQERRAALISAAVTGKIDVRGWVAPNACDAEVSQEATA